MQKYKQEFVQFMLNANALQFGSFVTKSGRKTPFFINTGNYNNGFQLRELGRYYAEAIVDNFAGVKFDVIFGPAYKGIPIAVATAIALDEKFGISCSYCSDRKEVKDHGDAGMLLGAKLKAGDRIVLVEDVTTAGTSVNHTMGLLSGFGVEVLGLVVSVDRQEKGAGEKAALEELKEKYGFKTASIVKIDEVVDYLSKTEIGGKLIITAELKKAIDEYYALYGSK